MEGLWMGSKLGKGESFCNRLDRPRSFVRVKRPEGGVYHPPPSSAKVKEIVGLYIYFPSGPSWRVIV
jgi:hypothetical protein